MVRRLLALLAVLLVASIGFPARAAIAPVLVFFPFSTGDGVPQNLGQQVTDKIASDLTAAGGVTVIHGDPGSKPTDFRVIARAAGADAYVTGSLVAVGAGSYAGIEQLVNARAGVLEWSASIAFRTVDDLTGQGRNLRELLLVVPTGPQTAGTLPVEATPTPVPSFGGILVLPADGNASRSDRDLATQAVTDAIKHLGFTVVSMPRKGQASAGLCSSTHAQLLLSTRLDVRRGAPAGGGAVQSTAIVSLTAFNCQTNALDPNPVAVDRVAPLSDDAIRGAVTDALVILPALPPAPNS